MSLGAEAGRAGGLLLGKTPPGRWPVPEPELLEVIAPFLHGDLLERGCRYGAYALRMRSLERPIGSEMFSAVAAVGRKLAAEGGRSPELGLLGYVVGSLPQPLARPVWMAAARLAAIAEPWLEESALRELRTLGLAPRQDEYELLQMANTSAGREQAAAQWASVLARSRFLPQALVADAVRVAEALPSPSRAKLLSWCCTAAEGEYRLELEASTRAVVQDALAQGETLDVELLAVVGLTAPEVARPLLPDAAILIEAVPSEWRNVGLLAEWLEQVLPEPPPERRLWTSIQRELPTLLGELDQRTRGDLLEEFLHDYIDHWGGAPPRPPLPPFSQPEIERKRPASRGPRVPDLLGSLRALTRLLGRPLAKKAMPEGWDVDDGLRRSLEYVLPPPRFLNLAVTDNRQRVLSRSRTLAPGREYLVRIDIGERDPASLVENPVEVPTELLEPSTEGYWLDVLLVSRDLEVEPAIHHLFLPFEGASWVCSCTCGEHVCQEQEREPYLYVSVRTHHEVNPDVTIRCTIYQANSTVQSATLHLRVEDGRSRRDAQRAVVDYTLSPHFTDIEALPARRINILTNQSADGTHRIVIKGDERAIPVDLTESAVSDILDAVRAELRKISLKPDGRKSQYDANNRKSTPDFVADLKSLALLGSFFWNAVVPRNDDRMHLQERLRRRSTIQVSRVTKVVFPWAVVYDIPRELQAEWELCQLIEEWEEGGSRELESYPEACPYDSEHHLNVLCPYGFWGFKHVIEQPPSVRQGALKTTIPVAGRPQAVLARSLDLDAKQSKTHLERLETCLGGRFRVAHCDSRDVLRSLLSDPALPLIYFYCHGKYGVLGDTPLQVPYLEIGHTDGVGPYDFAAWSQEEKWPPTHWAEVSPLVFINGCHTAELTPDGIVSFVEALAGMNVAGVVGTEISVAQEVAGEVGERFYTELMASKNPTVGTALYRTRIDLLRKGNVTALVYTPFCSMDLALTEQAP